MQCVEREGVFYGVAVGLGGWDGGWEGGGRWGDIRIRQRPHPHPPSLSLVALDAADMPWDDKRPVAFWRGGTVKEMDLATPP